MIEIPLTKGQIALIDDADQDLVCSYNSDHFEELQNKEYQGAFSYPQRPL
jgi:hypothetical protein